MNGIFAKWIFTAAYVFAGGTNQDLPLLVQKTPPSADVYQMVAIDEDLVKEPCPPAPPGVVVACPGPIFVAKVIQDFCTTPGVFTFTLRLGLIAQEPMGGKVWLEAPDGTRSLLAAFNAAPGMPAYVAASLQARSASTASCYAIKVDGNRPAEVIADPAVSFLTIAR